MIENWWSKRKLWEKVIAVLVIGSVGLFVLDVVITLSSQEQRRQEQAEEQAGQAEQDKFNAKREEILNRVTQSSGYKPQIIEWGGVPTLTMTQDSWNNLTQDEQITIMVWMDSQYDKNSIIVGRKKDASTIYMDKEVYSYP